MERGLPAPEGASSEGLPLREVLELGPMKGSLILAGRSGLDRQVTGVNVMEGPDICNWLGEHDLVITTGFGVKDDPQFLTRVLQGLHQHNAAGLGIKLNRFIHQLLPETTELADELGFPLIRIPYESRWIDILTCVTARILGGQAHLVQHSQMIHHTLTGALLRSGATQDVLESLADLLGGWVVHLDAKGEIAGTVMFPARPREFRSLIQHVLPVVHSPRALSRTRKIQPGSQEPMHAVHRLELGNRTHMVLAVPLTVDGVSFGTFCFGRPFPERLLPLDFFAVQMAADLVAWDQYRLRKVMDLDQRLRDQFIRDLLLGRHVSKDDMAAHLQALGWNEGMRWSVVVFELGASPLAAAATDAPCATVPEAVMIEALRQFTEREAAREVAVRMSDHVALVVGHTPEQAVTPRITSLHQQLQAELGRRWERVTVSAGVGRARDTVVQLAHSYREAHQALIVTKQVWGPGTLMHFGSLGVYRLFSPESPEVVDFCRESIGRLIAYDQSQGTNLVETLRIFFQSKQSVRKTAAALYVHYHTVRYRLQRIGDILGVDLTDPNAFFTLQLALYMEPLLRDKAKP